MKKAFNEEFAKFFENPSRENFRILLQNHLGEQNFLDFKQEWPTFPKLAKHILAMANSGGGVIVVGVAEKEGILEATGLNSFIDKADVSKQCLKYFTSKLNYDVLDFEYTSSDYEKIIGKKFQVVVVESEKTLLPFISLNNGEGIKQNVIYCRRGTNSVEVSYEELQGIINERISTQYSTKSELQLEEHLSHLSVLYTHVKKYNVSIQGGILGNITKGWSEVFRGVEVTEKNPNYPDEDFEEFISRMITLKKKRIENLIDQ